MINFQEFERKLRCETIDTIKKDLKLLNETEQEMYVRYIQMYIEQQCKKYREQSLFLPELIQEINNCNSVRECIDITVLEKTRVGTLVIGTVKNDIHDVGKNVVATLFKSYNYRVIDLGVNVTKEKFVEEAIKNKANIVGISAMLINTMNYMDEIVKEFSKYNVRESFFIMVGGACITEQFALQVGANAYTKSAADALEVANRYIFSL